MVPVDRGKSVVVFLQNAWSPYFSGRRWPRESWLKALKASRSGQRLVHLEKAAQGVTIWYDNTTPIVGRHPGSILPPDPEHIREVLAGQTPDIVVTCGNQALDALLPLWPGKLLSIPHPAYRVVKNTLLVKAGQLLITGDFDRLRLWQGRKRTQSRILPSDVNHA